MAPKPKSKQRPPYPPYPENTTRNRPLKFGSLIGVKVERELLKKLDREAAQTDRTRSWIIRQVLVRHYKIKGQRKDDDYKVRARKEVAVT